MKQYQFPAFALDPSKTWKEVPSAPQSTADVSRAVSALTIVLAYMMSGQKFRGSYSDYTLAEMDKELNDFCKWHSLSIDRVISWASSLLIPPTYQTPLGSMVERRMPSLGFALHEYQRNEAEWFASRQGGVAGLSCGTGKSVTAWAAAKAAVRNGRCIDSRCTIIAPVNAMGQWEPYADDLKHDFKEVNILSVDSTHKYKFDPRMGGALIVDECHKVKNESSTRSFNTFDIRLGYDWCLCLTGTLLHTGPEGVLMIQDLAVPGLSRFTDKWRFGTVFDCIVQKKVGRRTRSSLVTPAGEHFESFVQYLSRGVRSLSFASPTVREAVNLPGQTRTLVDSWPSPDWFITLKQKEREEIRAVVLTETGREPSDFDYTSRERLYWLPDCDWRWALGATSVAIMHERIALAEKGLDEEREPLPERLGEDDTVIGLPTFAKVRVESAREGRVDRCIERFKDSTGALSLRWYYAPGTDFIKPGPGVKIREVMKWVDSHPNEPALIGSVSSLSKRFIIAELEKRGKTLGVIDGTVSAKERSTLTARFQAGEIDYMVVQQVAGSESITLTRAATSFLIDHSWSPIHYTQYLARTCRTSQTRECEHYDLAFGRLQSEIVRTLQRGEAFDTRTRARLEELMQESLQWIQRAGAPN